MPAIGERPMSNESGLTEELVRRSKLADSRVTELEHTLDILRIRMNSELRAESSFRLKNLGRVIEFMIAVAIMVAVALSVPSQVSVVVVTIVAVCIALLDRNASRWLGLLRHNGRTVRHNGKI
jgi:hypothetical protein